MALIGANNPEQCEQCSIGEVVAPPLATVDVASYMPATAAAGAHIDATGVISGQNNLHAVVPIAEGDTPIEAAIQILVVLQAEWGLTITRDGSNVTITGVDDIILVYDV